MIDAERAVGRREVVELRLLPVRPVRDEAEVRLVLCRNGILNGALRGISEPAMVDVKRKMRASLRVWV